MELSLHEPVITTYVCWDPDFPHARKKFVEIRPVVLERMKMYTHHYVTYVARKNFVRMSRDLVSTISILYKQIRVPYN